MNETLGIKLYLDEEICTAVFDGFAEYLFNTTFLDKKTKEEKNYAPGTALQYFSASYGITKIAYPHLDLWTKEYDPARKIPAWYGDARQAFKSKLVKRIIENGEKLQPEKPLSIDRVMMIELTDACEKYGEVGQEVHGIEMRYCFITHFLVCGR